MKLKRILTALGLAFAWAFAAQAGGSLITGKIRVGAYDVEVQNASRTNWVDGELVITYLNTNATVTKSFTLPHPTTGRLLAVGGGGAGGQDSGRDEGYGLPGGGGAGGMVTNDNQAFAAATYTVTVGGGGLAPRKTTRTNGANGKESKVSGGSLTITANGGGGGGARNKGSAGGCGGGGSWGSSTKKSGGSKTQSSPGLGHAGGTGNDKAYGAGGGGAGGAGGDTAKETISGGKTTYGHSGAGGAGVFCDITGENVEYARGGDGGVPRVYAYHYYDEKAGREVRANTQPVNGKINGYRGYYVEASDGKPGLDGRGDGGGGSGHYESKATYAGSGGNGVVIVRIPPYKTTVEDALKTAFAGQSVTVSGSVVTLNGDSTGPIEIPDNLGAVTIKLDGHAITGTDGAEGDDITPGGDGRSALKIVPHEYDCNSGVTVLSVTGTGSLKGGNGGKGYPGGTGAAAVSADGFTVNVAEGIGVTAGTAGESYVQHPHKWAYTVKDNKIVAYCVADDGETCSYRDDHSRGPFVAVSAADAAYTAMRYDELTAVNGITPVTGIVVAPETYVGRDGTDYPESSTPPREQGAYTVNMQLGDLRITSDFTITEPKPSQGSVYQAWKTAERKGRDVQIALSATFDGSKAINDGNVLFLGSRCNAHSMATGTVEKSINAMTRYANVRWYAYGSSDPKANLVNQLTKKGEKVPYSEKGGKVTDETVHLEGRNHFVHKEMMDDLYAELVENRNHTDGYDLIILEFDGDLLCRNGESPYQLVYSLPTGWTDEKAATLRAAMSRYYAEDRVVWIVPDVNREKSDAGYTGEYPWKSNPEFIWQRAFLNATETEGYECPLQKNYEDANSLVNYLQEVLVGHFFSNAIIKDKLAANLTIRKVTPQMRADGGIWHSFEGGPSRYTIPEPRSGTTVTADVERVDRQVTVIFDMKAEQVWACKHDLVIGDDFRVVIDAELDGFFKVGEGEWQATNEGPATFTFTESNLDEDEKDFSITIEKDSPKIQNVKLTPDYTSEDVVRIYDGKGTNIVVKPIAPKPEDAIIRYSLDEHGTYTDNFALTNVCEKTKVWFEITDKNGEFTTATNFACVTILPSPEPELESIGIVPVPVEAYYNKDPQNISFTVTNAAGEVITPDPEKTKVYYKGPDDADWVPADEFAGISNVTKAAGSTDSNGVVTVEVKVSIEGYEDAIASSTVRVMPRVIAEQTKSATKPYDGTPLTCPDHSPDPQAATNYAYEIYHEVKHPEIYDGPPRDDWADAIGFADGDGLVSVPIAGSQTEVGSSPNTVNLEGVTFTGGANKDDYALSFPEGMLTVTAAPVTPRPPEDSADNPGDEPADDPTADPTLWAQNIVKCYDGLGTNVIAQVYNSKGDNNFTYEYSTNQIDFVAWEDLQFTNVVDGLRVWYRAMNDEGNYLGVTNFAFVTITNRPVTVVADGTNMVYGASAPDLANHTWAPVENLAADDGVRSVAFAWTNGTVVSSLPVGTYAGFVSTNSVPQPIVITNAAGADVTFDYAVTFLPGTLTVTKDRGYVGPIADVTYEGSAWEPALTVTNAAGAALAEGSDYTVTYHDNVHATNLAYAAVEFIGNYDGIATNCFRILRRPVTLRSGTETFTYDGEAHSNLTVTITSGSFVAGEGVTTNGFAEVKDVCSDVANDFGYDFIGGTLAADYDITVVEGKLAVVAAPVEPVEPTGTGDNPGDEPADDPTADPTLWARNVVKCYDGLGTNVIAQVYNSKGDNNFTYEYSTNKDDWVAWDALQFTNVVDGLRVWYRATNGEGNYLGVTNFAYVTITNRPVTVAANDTNMVFGADVPVPTWRGGRGLVPGHFLDVRLSYTNDPNYAVGVYPDAIVTNALIAVTNAAGADVTSNYLVSFVPGTLTVEAKSVSPDPANPTKPADPDMDIAPIDTLIYDGEPKEPEVAVTNGVTELIRDVDYTVVYGNNTNATEEAYAVVTGIGNYEGCFTNYFTILPREVTLMSGTKTMYLDPAHPGESVACSNALVFVVSGSFVTNAATGVKDGFVAMDMTVLESATPIGPVDNEFTAEVSPGLATNYLLTCEYGQLAILGTPVESHGEIHEEVPTQDGEGVIDVVMDNRDAGKYAADKPPELNELEELVEKDPLDDVEVRLLVSSNYLENSFCEVTNEVVNDARGKGKSDKEIKNYSYDALDISVNETHWHYEHYDDIEPTSVVTRDIGNEIDADHMLTITIPYAFNPKLIEFSVWRNHTNDSSGVAHEGVVELPYSETGIAGKETWKTNSTSVILRVHKFSVYVFKTLVLTAPQLTGSMHWKYHRAHSVFYGGLDVVCTNGDNRTISNLSYVYEDRDDCYLRSLTGGDRLSKTSAVTYGGKKFGLVRLDDVAVALREGALNVTSRYGVAETTFTDPSWKDRYVVPTLEERRIALATTSIEKLANGDPSVVDSTLGYLTWQEEGYDTVYWCALAEGLEPLPVDSLSGGTVPLTLAMANKAKAYGLPPLTPDSDPALVLEAFKVEDGIVRGRVAMREDDVRGVPGSNARLTVLGAAALTDAFVEVAWPQLSKDGSFSFRPPEEIRYFRARLTVRDVIR